MISDAHGRKTPGDRMAVGRIAVPDKVVRHSFHGKASVIWWAIHSAVGLAVKWRVIVSFTQVADELAVTILTHSGTRYRGAAIARTPYSRSSDSLVSPS